MYGLNGFGRRNPDRTIFSILKDVGTIETFIPTGLNV